MKFLPTPGLIATVIAFCSFIKSGYTQSLGLSYKADSIIHSYCSICHLNPADTGHITFINQEKDAASLNFHNCLIALKIKDAKDGFNYAIMTIAATDSNPNAPIHLYSRFLKARILFLKDGTKEALAEYLQLVNNRFVDSSVLVYVYSNIAYIYLMQEQYLKALHFFSVWENLLSEKTELLPARKIYDNIGICYLHLKNLYGANHYFQKSVAIAGQLKDTLGLAYLYTNIGTLYHNQNLVQQASLFFKKALTLAKATSDNSILAGAYRNMSILYEKKNRFRLALTYRKLYDSVIEVQCNADNISSLKDKEHQLEDSIKTLAQKEKDHLSQLRASEKDHQLQLSEQQRNALFAIAVILLFAAGFVYYAYQQKVKRNSIIDAQREELSLLNDTKDQLFSIISHDLRTLVYTLKVTLTRLRFALQHNQIEHAAVLAENTERVSGNTYVLLNNLLHWALSQTGQLSYKPERLCLKEIVDEVYKDLLPVADARNIQLMDTTPDDLYFTGDSNSVKIILRNLVDNAIKYTPANGEITISADQVNQLCHIRVQDSGTGMDQNIADAVQANRSKRIQNDTQGNRSTGLGLWLVKTMTEKNSGSLCICSKKGEGTTVMISFPL